MTEPQPTYTLDQLRVRMLQDPETLAWYELFSANPDLRAEADMNKHDAENGTHWDGCHLVHRACAMVAAEFLRHQMKDGREYLIATKRIIPGEEGIPPVDWDPPQMVLFVSLVPEKGVNDD